MQFQERKKNPKWCHIVWFPFYSFRKTCVLTNVFQLHAAITTATPAVHSFFLESGGTWWSYVLKVHCSETFFINKCHWVICSVAWQTAERASAPASHTEPWRSLMMITISTRTTFKIKKRKKVWLIIRNKVFPDSFGEVLRLNAWTHPPCTLFIYACFISLSHLTCYKCWFSSHTGKMDKVSSSMLLQ